MKYTINVTELSHYDLVHLLSTAFYGNYWMLLRYTDKEYNAVPEDKRQGDCLEDKCADILLNGGYISVIDLEAYGEAYGNLPHKVLKNENVVYKVTLADILSGIQNPEAADYIMDFVSENDDFEDGYNLMQIIVFGEVIYG